MNLVLKNMIAQEHFTIRNKNKAKIKKKVESTNFEIAHKTNVKKQSGAAVKRVGIQPPSSLHLEHYDGNMPREFGNRTFAASRNPYGNIQRSTKTAQSQRSHSKPFQGHKQSLKTTKLDESINISDKLKVQCISLDPPQKTSPNLSKTTKNWKLLYSKELLIQELSRATKEHFPNLLPSTISQNSPIAPVSLFSDPLTVHQPPYKPKRAQVNSFKSHQSFFQAKKIKSL